MCSDDGVIENHKVLTYIEYRAVSEVFPPHQRRGIHTRRAVRGWGVNISEDARHWIGLLQYNPCTYKTKSLPSCIGIQCSTHSPHPPPAKLERFNLSRGTRNSTEKLTTLTLSFSSEVSPALAVFRPHYLYIV